MNEIRNKYFVIKYDSDISSTGEKIDFSYLELKDSVKSFRDLDNKEFKDKLKNYIDNYEEGLFYKGFYICFEYKGDAYYIKHHHQTNEFINEVVRIIKYNNGENIFIKYGELD